MMKLIPFSEWYIESLRLTGFFAGEVNLLEEETWRIVTGTNPEATAARLAEGIRNARGNFEGVPLVLTIQTNRIDWLLAGIPTSELAGKIGFPAIGTVGEAWPRVQRLLNQWRPHMPSFRRVGIGAVAFFPVSSRQEGYASLRPYLQHVEIDPAGSTDLLFRINRPRPSASGISGLRINRVATWAVGESRAFVFQPSSQAADITSVRPVYSCRVELDINTAPDYLGLIDPKLGAMLMEECLSLAAQLIERGDH
jgi:hypothetical protein